jgi:hypothetical protein
LAVSLNGKFLFAPANDEFSERLKNGQKSAILQSFKELTLLGHGTVMLKVSKARQ